MTSDYRIERDSMGELQVPATALWGAQTQRAVNNFPISGLPMPPAFVRALGLIKWAAARTNRELGLLSPEVASRDREVRAANRSGRASRSISRWMFFRRAPARART